MFSIQGEGQRVIQISSPNKGDGKSLVVANLAVSIAQSDKKVLIIDADCRRPRQHKILDLTNSRGLVNVIRQDAPWRECLQPTPANGLWVLPSGPVPPNPAELLTSPQFKQFLDEARQEFDLILVDSPPLLAVTDPCVVAGKADGVILVLRLSRRGRPNAERACDIMKSLKVKVVGIVVNGVARQGGAGIYSSEQYDYAESYTDNENVGTEDSYYYHEDGGDAETSPAQPSVAASPTSPAQPTGGLWSRMFSKQS
jgi:capsular exopolysaccharide synthesis family protein